MPVRRSANPGNGLPGPLRAFPPAFRRRRPRRSPRETTEHTAVGRNRRYTRPSRVPEYNRRHQAARRCGLRRRPFARHRPAPAESPSRSCPDLDQDRTSVRPGTAAWAGSGVQAPRWCAFVGRRRASGPVGPPDASDPVRPGPRPPAPAAPPSWYPAGSAVPPRNQALCARSVSCAAGRPAGHDRSGDAVHRTRCTCPGRHSGPFPDPPVGIRSVRSTTSTYRLRSDR